MAITVLIIIFILFVVAILIGHFGLPEKESSAYQDPDPAEIMEGAEPFTLTGKPRKRGIKIGVLLVHGFEGSPYSMRWLGEHLHRQGFFVTAPLLPGHGTKVQDFIETRYAQWYQKVEDIYLEHRDRFTHFFIVGHSMGGNICLRLLENLPANKQPTGAVILAAPLFLNGWFNGKFIMKDWRLLFTGLVKIFKPYMKKPAKNIAAEKIAPWVGYMDYYTIPCLHSLKRNLAPTRNNLWRINTPMLMIQAINDLTVNFENQVYLYNNIRSKQRLAYGFVFEEQLSTHHVLTTHQESRERAFYYIEKFIEDAIKDFNPEMPRERPTILDVLKMWWWK